jgi:AcrR family transcriptional regulator/DNA-binding MarR family transcriptional regulator
MASRDGALSDETAPGGLSPAGDGAEREQISQIQRARILAAIAEVAVERGGGNVTVARVVARSGVSRRTFYEQFADCEECFLAAFDQAVRLIAARVVPAYEQPGRWRERARVALIALLEFLDEEPVIGRLVIVEPLSAGGEALERRQQVYAQLIAAVDRGRGEAKEGGAPPPLAAEGVVGGVLSLIHSHLLDGSRGSLRELLNPLMSMVVLPYLGPAAARRELAQPVPESRSSSRRTGFNPLRDLDMRLTYRTVRVLLAIGSHPGASNRRIADTSGVTDQGQISKLLARLQQLGLARNTGYPHAKGEPNAWMLTERGASVQEAISAQASRS